MPRTPKAPAPPLKQFTFEEHELISGSVVRILEEAWAIGRLLYAPDADGRSVLVVPQTTLDLLAELGGAAQDLRRWLARDLEKLDGGNKRRADTLYRPKDNGAVRMHWSKGK